MPFKVLNKGSSFGFSLLFSVTVYILKGFSDPTTVSNCHKHAAFPESVDTSVDIVNFSVGWVGLSCSMMSGLYFSFDSSQFTQWLMHS